MFSTLHVFFHLRALQDAWRGGAARGRACSMLPPRHHGTRPPSRHPTASLCAVCALFPIVGSELNQTPAAHAAAISVITRRHMIGSAIRPSRRVAQGLGQGQGHKDGTSCIGPRKDNHPDVQPAPPSPRLPLCNFRLSVLDCIEANHQNENKRKTQVIECSLLRRRADFRFEDS